MALNSINTNIAAIRAQTSISAASNSNSSSISRLSSGERITRAADDVAALSAGTSLETNVVTLRTALLNSFQGQTLLQVADGALAQITDILQRQKAIAVQAAAGSLTSAERGFLNQEFQQLTNEVNRLATETNFNGVALLDGTLDDRVFIGEDTSIADKGRGAIRFTSAADTQTFIMNGVTFEFDDAGDGGTASGNIAVNTFGIAGGSIDQYVEALANTMNNTTTGRASQAIYTAIGSTIYIETRAGGVAAEAFSLRGNPQSTAAVDISARPTNEIADEIFVLETEGLSTLSSDRGISIGDIIGQGNVGDSIVAAQQQTKSFGGIDFSNSTLADFTEGAILNIDDGDQLGGGNVTFEFDTDGILVTGSHVRIDATRANTKTEYIEAIVEAINTYTGFRADGTDQSDEYIVRQLRARREGDQVIFESRDVGPLQDKASNLGPAGNAATAFTTTNFNNSVIIGSATFTNGVNTGVNTSFITNSDFVGTIQGFNVTLGPVPDRVNIEITIGGRTYRQANINVTQDTRLRLLSDQGDYFNVDLQGATQNLQAQTQEDADIIAARLDKAFGTLQFYQNRDISSFSPVGSILTDNDYSGDLTGTLFTLNSADSSLKQITDIRVNAPLEGQVNGFIEFDIGGSTYRSRADIGNELYSRSIYRFTSLDNPNDILTMNVGDINGLNLNKQDGSLLDSIEFDTVAKAASFEAALEKRFGIGQFGKRASFLVGTDSGDKLDIVIRSVTTDVLYSGATPNVLTQDDAKAAGDMLDQAIDYVTSVRADVGSLQSRFGFASSNIESAILNQDAARGVLLDTDVATESTAFATSAVQLQAGISVLAQANLTTQNLLKLIG